MEYCNFMLVDKDDGDGDVELLAWQMSLHMFFMCHNHCHACPSISRTRQWLRDECYCVCGGGVGVGGDSRQLLSPNPTTVLVVLLLGLRLLLGCDNMLQKKEQMGESSY